MPPDASSVGKPEEQRYPGDAPTVTSAQRQHALHMAEQAVAWAARHVSEK